MSDTQEGSVSEGISAADVLQQADGIENMQAAEGQEVEKKAEKAETEPKVEEKKEEQSKQEKLFASKFAALSRKEKALREKERQIEARMAEIEQRLQAAQPKQEQAELEEPLELRIKKNPFETLKSMGLDYEALTKIALNDGQLPPELQVQLMREELEKKYVSRFEELEKKLTEKEKKEVEERNSQAISNFKSEIGEIISENTENYELLSVEGQDGVNLVYDVIEEHYNEHGEILDVKTAAELVENHLLEEAKKRVGLSKIKKLLGASEPKAQTEPKQTKPSVTLSNEQAQTSQTADRFMSDDESRQVAAKLIKWVE